MVKIQDIEQLVQAFEDCQLPRSQWTHSAHLAVALWFLLHYSEAEAIARIKSGIKRYNQAVGIENSATSGYHETLTLFWIAKIRDFLSANSSTQLTIDLWQELMQQCDDPKLPLQYYSRDNLMSELARLTWVEPDLQPLF